MSVNLGFEIRLSSIPESTTLEYSELQQAEYVPNLQFYTSNEQETESSYIWPEGRKEMLEPLQ